jgi:PTS system N-acetylglucosamine-specific IIA component
VSLEILSPAAGKTVEMGAVPDPVFAQSMVGPGIAVQPSGGRQDALAPVDGTVVTLHPHAFVIATETGQAVLVHLGIDTVKQKGAGFTVHVVKGDSVRAGQPLVEWDPGAVVAAGYSALVPVVALDASPEALSGLRAGADIAAGDHIFSWDD